RLADHRGRPARGRDRRRRGPHGQRLLRRALDRRAAPHVPRAHRRRDRLRPPRGRGRRGRLPRPPGDRAAGGRQRHVHRAGAVDAGARGPRRDQPRVRERDLPDPPRGALARGRRRPRARGALADVAGRAGARLGRARGEHGRPGAPGHDRRGARDRLLRGARRARPAPRRDGDLSMADDLELTEHATRNRAEWNALAPEYVAAGRAAWARRSPDWGMWSVPEEQLHILPDVRGADVVDLGCGTGYWCAWFARLGASPVGVDVSEAQLETARALQAEHGIEFPLLHASAEAPPFEDRSFDLVFSEYGAA